VNVNLNRALSVVRLIKSLKLKCSAALSILRHAVPPYSISIMNLAKEAENWAEGLTDSNSDTINVNTDRIERHSSDSATMNASRSDADVTMLLNEIRGTSIIKKLNKQK